MSLDLYLAFLAYIGVGSITPGPNNLMVMASGANFGFRRTLPHIAGIAIGFCLMLILIALGLRAVFDALPWLETLLLVASGLYLLYLAWKIATAAPPAEGAAEGRPFSFLQAAAFQWVNPKAWAMALSTITLYAPERTPGVIMILAATFFFVSLSVTVTWTVAGQKIRRLLSNPKRLRAFNWTMAVLLVVTLIPALMA